MKGRFLVVLSVEAKVCLFNCHRVLLPGSEKYFIRVHNDTQTSFEMKKDSLGRWKIMPPAPPELLLFEMQLGEELEKYCDNNR